MSTAPTNIDTRAKNTWRKSRVSWSYYQEYLKQKNKPFLIELIDLLFISNFKGGNASINEDPIKLTEKLKDYSDKLLEIKNRFTKTKLHELDTQELKDLIDLSNGLMPLTSNEKTKIDGFGPSYLSALLSAHFPELLPILDRRILSGLQVKSTKVNSEGQVENIGKYYHLVIRGVYMLSKASNGTSVIEIDETLFSQKLIDHYKKKEKPKYN